MTSSVRAVAAREAYIQQVLFDSEEAPKHTILVVEDDVLIRHHIADQLRLAGFGAIEADNADEALTILIAKTHIDLVITDIRLPGDTNGADLIRWIRRRAPEIKTVVVSAYLDPYWDLPVDAVFTKPIRIDALLRRLRELLPPAEQAGPNGR
jgi:DNA-binding response OmpR family regulator